MTELSRLDEVRTQLIQTNVDALACYPGPNTLYLTNYYGEPLDRHALFVLPMTGEPYFLAPEKTAYGIQEVAWIDRTIVVEKNEPGTIASRFWETVENVTRVAVDGQTPFSLIDPLQKQAPESASLTSADSTLMNLRRRKSRDEIDRLRCSAAIADQVSEAIRALGSEAIGRTEADLAAEIRGRLHRAGGTRLSFDVVVASGPNGAYPPHRNSDRRIHADEPVILDFGAFSGGYASDQTRTVVFEGTPPDGFENAYEAVRESLNAGVAAVEPGVTAGAVDRAAREAIEAHGLGEHIRHATGHGVGCEAHESPTIAAKNDRELEPGMVFSVEPGIYVEGEFGVRLEDLVVVTEGGSERLNDSPRTWRAL